jgi:hypothetical protein
MNHNSWGSVALEIEEMIQRQQKSNGFDCQMNERTVLCVIVILGLLRLEQLKWLPHNLDLIYWRLREQ